YGAGHADGVDLRRPERHPDGATPGGRGLPDLRRRRVRQRDSRPDAGSLQRAGGTAEAAAAAVEERDDARPRLSFYCL
ncbi:hypothetical protein SLS62_010287, partial [Diatrype stigma]